MDIGHLVQLFLVICHTKTYPTQQRRKKVDTNLHLRVVFAHSKGKGHQAIAKQFFGLEAKVQRSIKKLKKCCIVKKIQMTWLEFKGI